MDDTMNSILSSNKTEKTSSDFIYFNIFAYLLIYFRECEMFACLFVIFFCEGEKQERAASTR